MPESDRFLFTSESVTEGHPDKMCDQISDAVLDAIFAQDPQARVACETAITTGMVIVMGEVTTNAQLDVQSVVRETIRDIGYDRAKYGFDCDTCSVMVSLDKQSGDIAMGVDTALEAKEGEEGVDLDELGAGDQGLMFGYATNETSDLMPLPINLAHELAQRLATVRKDGTLEYLRPDGKSQVTVEYVDGKPVHLDTILISTQHAPEVDREQIYADLVRHVIDPVAPKELYDGRTRVIVNPTGRFVTGGPLGDAGLTGRKIIVDTYGGMGRHGGGAFSGKDPTKVDRSAAYAARHVAKNIVAADLAERCEVQLAYAIGVAQPVSLMVDTFGTARIPESHIETLVREHFDLRPAAIIRSFDLRRPIYRQTAAYGHFGRSDVDLPWERTDKAEALREAALGMAAKRAL